MINLILATAIAGASSCPSFTEDQTRALELAYAIGNNLSVENGGILLSSIVWQEAFVGEYIVRFNPNDGRLGSYGLGHMQFTTFMHLQGYENNYQSRTSLEPYVARFLTDDIFALIQSKNYLQTHLNRLSEPFSAVARYNGSGRQAQSYANQIQTKYELLNSCNFFHYIYS